MLLSRGDVRSAEKWATTHLFPVYVTHADWFRADHFLSAEMCIDQSLAAIYMPWCCQIVVLPAAGALYYDDVSAAAAASQGKKRRITHFFYVVSYLCRSSAFVRAACVVCDDDATGPRSMRQQNKLRASFVFVVENSPFAVCARLGFISLFLRRSSK